MRIGSLFSSDSSPVGSRRVFRRFYDAVCAGNELAYVPHEYPFLSDAERDRAAAEFFGRCDLVAGVLEPGLVAARARAGSTTPWVFVNDLHAGGWELRAALGGLRGHDVALAFSQAEAALARTLFDGLDVRVLPHPVDRNMFRPVDAEERRAAREAMGIGEHDPVMLYMGRIGPDRNAALVMRVFRAVRQRLPNAHLVMAGAVDAGGALGAFDVSAPGWAGTFNRWMADTGGHVHAQGSGGPARMRELFGLADVVVDLATHPDDHAGLAAEQAMACGTPVVGAAWGALRDAVVDGETGYLVSAAVTPTGVRVSAWEAVNRIVSILRDPAARERMGRAAREASARSCADAYSARLKEILAEAAAPGRSDAPVRATPVAERVWSAADPRSQTRAAYRRGGEGRDAYAALAAPMAAVTEHHVPVGEPLDARHVLSLVARVVVDEDGAPRLDCPFHPHPLDAPAGHRDAVMEIVAELRGRAGVEAGALLDRHPHASAAVAWMLEAGVLLRTRPAADWLDPASFDADDAPREFSVLTVDRAETDFLVFQ